LVLRPSRHYRVSLENEPGLTADRSSTQSSMKS
jgi:hypothetical protein